jgi:hypothetical protein
MAGREQEQGRGRGEEEERKTSRGGALLL